MKLYFSTIFVFILLLVAAISNGTFILIEITKPVILSYTSVALAFIVILCCIEAIIEHTRERITNDVINDILDFSTANNLKVIELYNKSMGIYNVLYSKLSKLNNDITELNLKSNEAINVKLNNNLIETHQIHEVLKEVFMLDASIAKDTAKIKQAVCTFNSPSIDDLRNGFNSTSTSNSTFKDLVKGLGCVQEITNEELLELHPELEESVETPLSKLHSIISQPQKEIKKKGKK